MGNMRRRATREKVVQILYAHELSGEPIVPIMETILADLKTKPNDFEFAKSLVYAVLQHKAEIDKLIRSKVMHWESERIAVVDRMILRMAIAEFLYLPDIPPKVTINESIEIGKNFSTADSGGFINGVLDAILAELRSKGAILKTGRGLVDFASPHYENDSARRKPRNK